MQQRQEWPRAKVEWTCPTHGDATVVNNVTNSLYCHTSTRFEYLKI